MEEKSWYPFVGGGAQGSCGTVCVESIAEVCRVVGDGGRAGAGGGKSEGIIKERHPPVLSETVGEREEGGAVYKRGERCLLSKVGRGGRIGRIGRRERERKVGKADVGGKVAELDTGSGHGKKGKTCCGGHGEMEVCGCDGGTETPGSKKGKRKDAAGKGRGRSEEEMHKNMASIYDHGGQETHNPAME